jgi:NADH dehydrogenase
MFQYKHNLRYYMGSLVKINEESNTIETDSGTLDYDHLVLAMGAESNYFGMDNVKNNALPMKTIDDAINLRNHILLNLEKLVKSNDPLEREIRRNIVIAGGGPTGVEVSGMIAEMGKYILEKDYPELKGRRDTIFLVDAGHALLGPMSEKSQEEALRVLTRLGVQVKLGTAVKDFTDDKVILSTGEIINSNTLIWASGVIAREAPGLPQESIAQRGRRIIVDEYNRVSGTSSIFAIGDQCVQTTDKNYPNGHPQLAQVAIQQGKLLAENLVRLSKGQTMKPFSYYNKGTMAIISKFKAVVDLPKGFFKGFIAWLVWLFIHIIPIAGFRNKAKLAFNWFWSFITNDPTLRLIIRPRKGKNR